MRRGGAGLLLAGLCAGTVLGACGGGEGLAAVARRMSAAEMGVAYRMPDLELTAHDGTRFHLARGTAGRIGLIFFGYTHCPDVCPLSMSVIGAAIERLEPEERAGAQALFVTVDPRRDDPERIGLWLRRIGSPALGLTGTVRELDAALAAFSLSLPPSTTLRPIPGSDSYLVPHPSAIYLSTPDGAVRFLYPFGATADELVADIRPRSPDGERLSVYARLHNDGTTADTLLAISSAVALRGSLHESRAHDGVVTMVPVAHVVLPAGAVVELAPARLHGMLEGLIRDPPEGDTLVVRFVFARAGGVDTRVAVVGYGHLHH